MKKSQIQIGETIAVLFVFIILIVVGLVVYDGMERSKMKSKEEEKVGLTANEVAQRVMFLPEISCSSDNVPRYNCFDRVRLENSTKIMEENRPLYWDLFYDSRISVEVIYPSPNPPFIIYENEPDDWDSRLDTIVPVTIFNPLAEKGNEYSFGLLKVEVFTR